MKFSLEVSGMDKNNVGFGIIFICIGVFAAIIPYIGVLSPGESFDPRLAPVAIVIGIVFLIMGAMSKSETGTLFRNQYSRSHHNRSLKRS